MACLARVTDDSGYIQLRSSWDALGFRERSILTEHFLADGISDRAFIFEFLPACVNHAQTNPIIGLTLMLEVLVDLLSNLALALPDLAVNPAEKMITVDLSDMSEFVAVVQNRFVFQTCMARSRFNKVGNRLRVEMTGGNWARTSDVDSDMTTLAYGIKDRPCFRATSGVPLVCFADCLAGKRNERLVRNNDATPYPFLCRMYSCGSKPWNPWSGNTCI
eukprot:s808_g1.t1